MSVPLETFAQLEIRVGRIVEVEDIPQARKPLYRFKVDFGPVGTRQCVAGIKQFYAKDQLIGKLVVAIVNLQPKSIAGVVSECMLLASFDDTALALLEPDKEMPPGTKVA